MENGPILLNIGNTHVQRQDSPGAEIVTVETAAFRVEDLPKGVPCAAACVVPAFLPALKDRHVLIVNAETAGSLIDFSAVDPRTLGADRIANAAALIDMGITPAVCIDAGTAVTFEVVSGKRFLGGAILPGRRLLRKALHTGTAQLPEIPLAGEMPSFPAVCTVDAIRWGTDGMLVEGVKGLLCYFPQETYRYIVTGGDAPFLKQYITNLEVAPHDLTLRGVHSIYRSYCK